MLIIVVLFAIVGVFLKMIFLKKETEDFTSLYLNHFVCDWHESYCHPYLEGISSRRTHKAKHKIEANETLLILPNRYLISVIDALRDNVIQKELFSARHELTNNPIDACAFLAAYLLKRKKNATPGDHMLPFFKI